ncbi:MAG: WecB/TagA/CpsF family glycosyltransferase [Hydrogenibacillus sp.]|nr:WecB/TagA/CpsF family glycosyltransferase [Hydrogenibacillus sp.]
MNTGQLLDTEPLMGLRFVTLTQQELVNALSHAVAKRLNGVERLNRVESAPSDEQPLFIVTANAEIVMRARRDAGYRRILHEADVIVPDGIGVVLAARLLGRRIPERIAGIDLMQALIARAEAEEWRVFFLGARPEVLPRAIAGVQKRHPKLIIDGHHGYFGPEQEAAILQRIAAFRPALLFVGLGVPKQEQWIVRHRAHLPAVLAMGVGGSFDVLGGAVRRAPLPWRRLGLEWLWRLKEEPWRARRMAALPRFALLAVAVRLGLAREEPGRRSL